MESVAVVLSCSYTLVSCAFAFTATRVGIALYRPQQGTCLALVPPHSCPIRSHAAFLHRTIHTILPTALASDALDYGRDHEAFSPIRPSRALSCFRCGRGSRGRAVSSQSINDCSGVAKVRFESRKVLDALVEVGLEFCRNVGRSFVGLGAGLKLLA